MSQASAEFSELAVELAQRDRDLARELDSVREPGEALRLRAVGGVEAFREAARKNGAEHLCDVAVGPLEADEKHVDCLQFRVARGRFEGVCVVKSRGDVTLVGPYKRGKLERPCRDYPIRGPEVDAGLDGWLLELLREASAR